MKSTFNFFLLILLLLGTISCDVTKKYYNSYKPLDSNEQVTFLKNGEIVPESATLVGAISINYNLFYQNCDYEKVIDKAESKAREIGGNMVKIIYHRPVNVGNSTCHKIKAKVYYSSVEPERIISENKIDPAISESDFGKLYVYRFPGASLFRYNLYLNDSLISNIKHNSKQMFKIDKTGKYTLRIGKDKKEKILLEIKSGMEYFIKVGIHIPFLVEKPTLTLMDPVQGLKEYRSFKADSRNFN